MKFQTYFENADKIRFQISLQRRTKCYKFPLTFVQSILCPHNQINVHFIIRITSIIDLTNQDSEADYVITIRVKLMFYFQTQI